MTLSTAQAVNVLWSLFALAMLGLIWHGYVTWRLAAFREQLFTLRAELFDYAANGDIAFDSVPYVMLRTMLNGFLRFGHRMDGIPFLVFMARLATEEPTEHSFALRWRREALTLDVDQRTTLEDILRRTHVAVIEQAILSSLVLSVLAITGIVVGGLVALASRAKQRLRAPFGRFYARHGTELDARLIRPLDELAFEEGLLAA